MLRFDHVSLSYGSQKILNDLCFEIEEGQFAVLIGPSGCGKTTTLKMINRLIQPDTGKIYLNEEDITSKDKVELRRHIGYVIQQIGLFPNMTVAQNICVVPKLLKYSKEQCDQIADRSTASRGDVQVVVDGLLYILKQRLQKGETVQLGDLGHFQAVIGSKGTKLESDFNASLIKRPRIVFRPSVTLKSVTGLAKFEKIVPDAPAPGGGDSESPDEI